MTITDTQMPECQCPHCGGILSGAASFEGHAPEPGDFSVCIYCTSVLVFQPNLQVRLATNEDMKSFSPEEQASLIKYQNAVKILNAVRSLK